MATNFPTGLDSLTNPTPLDYLDSPSHSGQHANANDAIEAIEAKLGISSSTVNTSHDYKLSEIISVDKAVGKTAEQTLENKTLDSPVIDNEITGSAILDEDNMESDSDKKVPTQQSVKAYVDGRPTGIRYADDGGANDDYAITVSPAPVSYALGDAYMFKANTANTGESTLNVNSLGKLPIRKKHATVLASNDILAKQMVLVAVGINESAIVDSYSEENKDNNDDLYAGFRQAMGQTFTNPYKATLKSCKFYLAKTGTPPGNIVAKLYAVTGSMGSTAVPTGAALATSANVSASTLAAGYGLITFTFSDNYEMQEGVNYAIVCEYNAGDASNHILIGGDYSSASHAGNMCRYGTSSWSVPSTTADNCFYVYADTKVAEMLSQISN